MTTQFWKGGEPMLRFKVDKTLVTKCAAILMFVPLVLLGYAGGPDAIETSLPHRPGLDFSQHRHRTESVTETPQRAFGLATPRAAESFLHGFGQDNPPTPGAGGTRLPSGLTRLAWGGSAPGGGEPANTAYDSPKPQSTGSGPRPAIGAVLDGFNFTAGIAPSTWIAIFGRDLSTETKDWNSDVQGTRLPTTVGGVSVTINDRAAVVHFINPTQVNILVPSDIGTGDMNVIVRNANGVSDPVTVRAALFKPVFYAPFSRNAQFFVTAVSLTGEWVGTRGLDPRVTRAARPGEILQIFATGFGPTNPVVPVDQIFTGAPVVTTPVRIRFGDVVANVAGMGNLVGPGLYQFNVTVPETLPNGEYPLIAEIGGVTSGTNVLIPVQR